MPGLHRLHGLRRALIRKRAERAMVAYPWAPSFHSGFRRVAQTHANASTSRRKSSLLGMTICLDGRGRVLHKLGRMKRPPLTFPPREKFKKEMSSSQTGILTACYIQLMSPVQAGLAVVRTDVQVKLYGVPWSSLCFHFS